MNLVLAALGANEVLKGLNGLGAGVGYSVAGAGASIGVGIVAHGAITSMARQPEMAGMTRTNMFLGIAFCEAFGLIGFVVFILLKFT